MSSASVLTVNAGSTSLKLHLVEGGEARPLVGLDELDGLAPAAVGHRVVHGGERFSAPALIDDAVVAAIEQVSELAPLHNRPALEGIARLRARLPQTPQVAVFDTAFHRTIPEVAATYALPLAWRERYGIRRYGFHGLSVRWAVRRAGELAPAARRLVVCHLGGGCSVTAVRDGRSLDTSMGYSPLDGVPMATRSGALDPAIPLRLVLAGLDAEAVDRELNRASGLLGLSGTSSRVEALERAAAGEAPARLALDVFAYRVAAAVGAMSVACGGLDALVFSGGVGEHSAGVRSAVCARLAHLGVRLDPAREAEGGDRDLADASAPARVLVIAAREELVIAEDTVRAAGLDGGAAPPAP